MSFGGSVAAMISSLKNNKRPRQSAHEKYKHYINNVKKRDNILPEKKLSKEQLKEIRDKIQAENKKSFIKQIVAFIFAIVFILTFILILKYKT